MLQIVNPDTALADAEPWPAATANARMQSSVYRWLLTWNVAILLLVWGTFQDAWEALVQVCLIRACIAFAFAGFWMILGFD